MRRSALATVMLAGTAGRADDGPPPVRDLLTNPTQLAAWLRDHDPMSLAAREKVTAAAEQAEQARVLPNPQANAGIGGIVIGSPNHSMGNTGPTGLFDTTNLSIGVSELVEIGKRAPRRDAADLRTREASETAVGSLGGRLNDATTMLGKLAYVAAKRALVAQNLAAAKTLQDKEQNRRDKQDLAGNDFARIELDTEALELDLSRADSDVAVALATCTATLFAPCSAAGLDANVLDVAAPLPDALPQTEPAIAERPVHQSQRLEAAALGQDAVLAEHRKIPDPTFGLSYTYDTYQYSGSAPQTLGVSVGIPLPLFDRGNHDAESARANARSLGAQEQALIRIEGGVVQALATQATTLKATLARLEHDSVPKSQTIVVNTRKAFDGGQSGLADLLLAERQYRDLQSQALDTRFELFNVRVGLRQSLGIDDKAARGAVAK